MKIQVTNCKPCRKLMALVDNHGFWIRSSSNPKNSYRITESGATTASVSLEDILAADTCNRTPIYEGETFTVTF